jgi:NTP pyrophosphatase (non-canonical NTP hydrolase)
MNLSNIRCQPDKFGSLQGTKPTCTGYNYPMDIKELSQAMQDFVTAKGWYGPDTPKKQTPRNIAISLSLEASEVLEQFQWDENSPDKIELSGELADVALYLLQLARLCEIDLEQAILAKLDENYLRTWPDNRVK